MTNQQLFEYLKDQAKQCQNEQSLSSIIRKIKELIETSDNFDIAYAVWYLGSTYDCCQNYDLSPEWIKAQLDRGIGNVVMVVVWLNAEKPWFFDMQWAKQQIEQSHNGNVAWAAYLLYKAHVLPMSWVKQQIERGIGDVHRAAYLLYEHARHKETIDMTWVKQQCLSD